ncbi:MAG: hypothetical protein WCC37_25165 [Candidatus Sulfotelmatobacter sp.]
MRDIKATVLRYCELSWGMLTKFKAFMKWSTFCTFDPAEFTTPSLRVVTATNERGEHIVFAPIETCLFVSGYALSPTATKDEAFQAGNAMDAMVARVGKENGISKMLVVLPKNAPADLLENEDGEVIRVFVRKIPQSVLMGAVTVTPLQTAYLN